MPEPVIEELIRWFLTTRNTTHDGRVGFYVYIRGGRVTGYEHIHHATFNPDGHVDGEKQKAREQ